MCEFMGVHAFVRSESKASLVGVRDDAREGRSPAISNHPRYVGNRQSIDVGTRKMVNYA